MLEFMEQKELLTMVRLYKNVMKPIILYAFQTIKEM